MKFYECTNFNILTLPKTRLVIIALNSTRPLDRLVRLRWVSIHSSITNLQQPFSLPQVRGSKGQSPVEKNIKEKNLFIKKSYERKILLENWGSEKSPLEKNLSERPWSQPSLNSTKNV